MLGLFDKGKTFVLNHLTESQLPSGKKVSTKGLSFKHVSVEGTKFIVLDSEGRRAAAPGGASGAVPLLWAIATHSASHAMRSSRSAVKCTGVSDHSTLF
mgnify:CR=1 FL=1